MCGQAKQTGMGLQTFVAAGCMLDGMHPDQQLGEEQGSYEEEMTPGAHAA